MNTKLTKIIIAAILGISITGNLYYFGNKEFKEYKQTLITQGQVQIINAIVGQVRKTGQIQIQLEEGNIILIEKK